MVNFLTAVDGILSTFKTAWDANTPAITTTVPAVVYEALEPDLKPHPRTAGVPWCRVVVRHSDASKVSLTDSSKTGRYRRNGFAWVQVFVPDAGGMSWGIAQQLAQVARNAFEGKRAANGAVLFTKTQIVDRPKDGPFFNFDIKAFFYWDELK